MPSPFPGMDPFIERLDWDDFHVRFTLAIADALVPRVRPKYMVRAARRAHPEHREAYLTVRLLETLEVVTVIEVLSPTNKRRGSDGQREYLAKRETVLTSGTHLVELDLLRGGERMPTVESLPLGDFFALVYRGNRRPKAEVYAWPLRDRMPTVPVPLAKQDPDVALDLQAVFDVVYDRAGYDYSLPYAAPAHPPLSSADADWAADILRRAGRGA